VEKVLLKFEKKLPSTGITCFVVTGAVVDNPRGGLEKLMAHSDDARKLYEGIALKEKNEIKEMIKKRQKDFLTRYGVVFGENRIDLIANQVIAKVLDIQSVYEEAVNIANEVKAFETKFAERHGVRIELEEGAIDRITEIVLDESAEVSAIWERFSQHYEHGLRLIRDKTGMQDFVLTQEAVDDPEGFLNRLIQETYQHLKD
jgi:hypothetical protein